MFQIEFKSLARAHFLGATTLDAKTCISQASKSTRVDIISRNKLSLTSHAIPPLKVGSEILIACDHDILTLLEMAHLAGSFEHSNLGNGNHILFIKDGDWEADIEVRLVGFRYIVYRNFLDPRPDDPAPKYVPLDNYCWDSELDIIVRKLQNLVGSPNRQPK